MAVTFEEHVLKMDSQHFVVTTVLVSQQFISLSKNLKPVKPMFVEGCGWAWLKGWGTGARWLGGCGGRHLVAKSLLPPLNTNTIGVIILKQCYFKVFTGCPKLPTHVGNLGHF